jgi:chemotaxis signal transduction protein
MLVLRFSIAGIAHAIDCHDVVEVIPCITVQSIFGSPAWMRGIFVFRGQPVPVIDLGSLIAGVSAEEAYSTRILVVRHGKDGFFGLMADRATDVEQVPDDHIRSAPMHIHGAYWSGRMINRPMSDTMTFLIDPATVLPREITDMLNAPLESA